METILFTDPLLSSHIYLIITKFISLIYFSILFIFLNMINYNKKIKNKIEHFQIILIEN